MYDCVKPRHAILEMKKRLLEILYFFYLHQCDEWFFKYLTCCVVLDETYITLRVVILFMNVYLLWKDILLFTVNADIILIYLMSL